MSTASTPGTRSFGAAYHRLQLAQKNSRGAPVYSRFINRPLGRVFAAAAFALDRTPNQVTALSAACTFTGIAVLALVPAGWATGIAVGVLLMLGYALDSADGQLARLRGGGSPEGEWLDHVVDSAKLATIHLAVLITMFRWFTLPDAALLLVPIVFSAVASVHFFGMIVTDLVQREHHYFLSAHVPYTAEVLGDKHPTLLTLARIPVDYGLLCFNMLLLGWQPAFLVLYTLMALASTGYLVLAGARWYRQVRSLSGVQ